MADDSKVPGRSVTSRALVLLDAFDGRHRALTLSQIARRADLPLATAHRYVAELVEGRALVRREDGAYEIGTWLWQLGSLAPDAELRRVALPHLQELFAATRETVHLAVRDGHEALYVERLNGVRSIHLMSRAGGHLPLHSTGVGKVLLAHAPAETVRAVLTRLRMFTPSTVTDPTRLAKELAATRESGVAWTSQEMSVGVCSVAVPVYDQAGGVAAALGLAYHSSRREMARLVPLLRKTAADVSARLLGGDTAGPPTRLSPRRPNEDSAAGLPILGKP
jgi:DNA-binding IclR family transcriptional regulator